MNRISIHIGDKKIEEDTKFTAISSAKTVEELFVLEIERLQRQIKPGTFRPKSKKQSN